MCLGGVSRTYKSGWEEGREGGKAGYPSVLPACHPGLLELDPGMQSHPRGPSWLRSEPKEGGDIHWSREIDYIWD